MKALYPGTFDPPTLGHQNIIKKAASIFDHLTVGIGVDSEKKASAFTIDERLAFLKAITADLNNVAVVSFSGLTARYAKEYDCIVRSIRNGIDLEYEKSLAHTNYKLESINTLFLLPDEPYQSISSTLVKDIARRGGCLEQFVPQNIEPFILDKFS